ncbi:MAG TPA: TetR family transcriptional regulator, partial [Candidatus Dormibacteraeota bacterium]
MTGARRPGRRSGPTVSRGDILAAARGLFAERGYDGATIRAIAQEAGVDAALVHHFFGTKEQVFVAAMELPFQPAELLPQILGGPREQLGERFVRTFLALWRDPDRRAPILALLRSATTNEQAAEM